MEIGWHVVDSLEGKALIEPEEYTCYICAFCWVVFDCEWAFDIYNTHDDCLAEK